MKGIAALSIFIVGALLLTVAASSADAGVLTSTGGSAQISGAIEAVWGQSTYSWDSGSSDRDSDRRSGREGRNQAFGALIMTIRMLTGPENWGVVSIVSGETRREDEYTDRW